MRSFGKAGLLNNNEVEKQFEGGHWRDYEKNQLIQNIYCSIQQQLISDSAIYVWCRT